LIRDSCCEFWGEISSTLHEILIVDGPARSTFDNVFDYNISSPDLQNAVIRAWPFSLHSCPISVPVLHEGYMCSMCVIQPPVVSITRGGMAGLYHGV